MINESMIEEYTENIDTSEMIIEYYKRRKTQDLERYFLQIEDWLTREVTPGDNKPLVIDTDVGVEKKTLLVKWMGYHLESSKKKFSDLIIPHFAGTGGKSSNYFYAMYKILIGLREHFDISQKVELLENKILMYFNYWLDLCNKTLIGRVVDDSNVVLIFDGIDLFRDSATGEDTSVALWLAQSFPSRIKVIVTAEADSEAMNHFKKYGCKVLKAESEPRAPLTLINNYITRSSFIVDEHHKNRVIDILKNKSKETLNSSLFMKIYLSTLIPCPCEGIIEENEINKEDFENIFKNFDFRTLERINNVDELSMFLLNYFSKAIMDPKKFKDILVALTLSEKGLSTQEIFSLTRVTQKEWKHLVAILEPFLMKYKDLWKISEESFRKAISQQYLQNNSEYVIKLHTDIAEVLSGTSNSLRKLEEETYHLFQCKSYFKLKEAVTNIENFLLLFNPRNKYELCRYWQTLEINGFDPASEYTNAIEGFDLRYRPTPEQTFMIILQISRFLQEFGDFETRHIPDYRHPPIVGGTELKQIGLKREIKKLGMFISDEIDNIGEENEGLEDLEHQLAKEFPEYTDVMLQDLVRKIHDAAEKRKKQLLKKQQGLPIREDEEEQQDLNQTRSKTKTSRGLRNVFSNGKNSVIGNGNNRKDLPILSTIEAINVDIPKHREEFIEFYINQINEKDKSRNKPVEYEQKRFDEDDSIDEDPEFPDRIQDTRDQIYGRPTYSTTNSSGNKSNTKIIQALESESEKLTQLQKHLNEDQPTFYYYKRWLWMMFPWVCLSYKNNYSRIIFECFSSPTKYISVTDERERTMQALRLAIESKIKKELVYAKPGDKTQFSVLKNLKKNIPGFLPSSRKIIRALPPAEKSQGQSEFNKTRTSTRGIMNSSKKSLKLGDLSPVNSRTIEKICPQTTRPMKRKGNHLFVTGDYASGERPSTSFTLDLTQKSFKNMKPNSLNNLDNYDTTSFNRTRTTHGTATTLSKTLTFSDQRVQNMLRNAEEAIGYMIRPEFMNNVFTITPKQLEMFDTKVIQLKKDMNDLVHLRKACEEKLNHFNALEEGLNNRGALDCTEKMNAKIEKINEEIAKAENLQNEAMEHGRRLQLIIEVCSKNRTQNELWIHNLNYLVNNFKKVIAYEEASIDKAQRQTFILQQQANKIIEDYGKKMTSHHKSLQGLKKESRKRQEIIAKITETQQRLQRMISDTTEASSIIEEPEATVIFSKEQMERIREKEKHDLENLEEMREQIDMIRDTIGLDFETPKFKEFVYNLEKMSDFNQAIYENENEIEKLQEELAVHSKLLETYQKARLVERRTKTVIRSEYANIKDEDKLQALIRERRRQNEELTRGIDKNTKLVLDAKNTLVKICMKIGLEMDDNTLLFTQLPAEEIAEKLQEKINIVKKSVPEEDFERFKKGKMNFDQYYRERGYDFEIDKTHIFNNSEHEKDFSYYRRGDMFFEQSQQHEMP